MDSFLADGKSHLAAERHLILVKITQTNGLDIVYLIWPEGLHFFVSGRNVQHFLGAFAKLRKVTVSFVMSVCPTVCVSVRVEQLGSHWTDLHEI